MQETKPKVAIYGAGSLGTVLGAFISRSGKDVVLINHNKAHVEALRKNGRLSNLKAKVASLLNIKPVMTSTPSGSIAQLVQCRGMSKALTAMVDNIAATVRNPSEKVLAISHCNCPDRAMRVRDALLERIPLREVILLDTRGISSLYASDGGIIVVV